MVRKNVSQNAHQAKDGTQEQEFEAKLSTESPKLDN